MKRKNWAGNLAKKAFESCHRYEESLYTDAALDAVYMNNLISAHSEITLDSNDTRFFMYGMEFNLQDGEPLLMNMRGKYGVDVSELYFVPCPEIFQHWQPLKLSEMT